MMKTLLPILALFIASFTGWQSNAYAHAIIAMPSPRPLSDPGNTTGPCGPYSTTTPTVLQAGSTIQLQWTETIQHHGNFQFYFAPATVTDTLNTTLLPLAIPSPTPTSSLLYAAPSNYNAALSVPIALSATVTLPSTPCPNCTIQLFQVNTDGVAGTPVYPTAADAGTVYYYTCADVQLTSGAVPTPTPTVTTPSTNCAPTSGGTSGGGSGGSTPSPTTTPSPLAPTFTNVNANIIQPMCISCHATANATNANTSLANYGQVKAYVDTTNPTLSLIYELTEEGPAGGGMPPAGNTALTATQETLLLQWIQAGAPNN